MQPNTQIDKIAANAHDAVDRASQAAADAADDAVSKAKPALDRATRAAHQVVDKAANVAAPTADWLSAQAEAVRAAPDRLAEGGRQLVSNHPWKSVGAALAIGLLIGRVMR